MSYGRSRTSARIQGMKPGSTWQGAIRSNGMKPTIYPHTKGGHRHIGGFSSKSDHFGCWHEPHKR